MINLTQNFDEAKEGDDERMNQRMKKKGIRNLQWMASRAATADE
jgi:hypothetical protein